MKYHELKAKPNRAVKRVGRGISAGQGKTAGRGTKGQGARSGRKKSPIFQGGTQSLVKAIPKLKGFKSIRPKAQVVYLDHLNNFKDQTVDNFVLYEQGYIKSPYARTKIITRGEITVPVKLKVQAVSASSAEAIKKAGGSVEIVDTPMRQAQKENKETDK